MAISEPEQVGKSAQSHQESQRRGDVQQPAVGQAVRIEGQESNANKRRPAAQEQPGQPVQGQQQQTGQQSRGQPAGHERAQLRRGQTHNRRAPPGHRHPRIADAQRQAGIAAGQPGGKIPGVAEKKRFIGGQEDIQIEQAGDEDQEGQEQPVDFRFWICDFGLIWHYSTVNSPSRTAFSPLVSFWTGRRWPVSSR